MLRRSLQALNASLDTSDYLLGGGLLALFVGVLGKADVFAALIATGVAVLLVVVLGAFAAR